MAMVALNAARDRVVPRGSLEARWLVDEEEVDEYIKHAATQPKMQKLMAREEAARLEDEERSALAAEEFAAHRARKLMGA